MNTFTDHNRQMAETLRELSMSPVPSPDMVPTPLRRFPLKLAAVLAGTALLLAGAAFGLRSEGTQTPFQSAPAAKEQLPPLSEASPSVAAPMVREITGSGYVIAPDMAVIYAERGGTITDILVEPGDHVVAGQALLLVEESGVRFAAQEAQLAHTEAKLTLAAARISEAQAKNILNRRTELRQRGVIASERLEDAEHAFLIAANSVEQAKATLDDAELALQIAEDRVADLTVRAPIPGTVTQLSAHVGDAVLDRVDAIHDGIGLMIIARLDTLAIDADVAEKAIGRLQANLVGEAVLDAFPDHTFNFELHRVAPYVNAARGTVALRLAPIAPPPGIRPGMAARIRIALSPSSSHDTQETGARN
ncbi:efflux RND transporter periplasmic adaptor subunit [uncultured Tateyamaria sp.]|uniref:efflux RND transporter periplasmic adaptor subunit n=1 Tax=uncultured Tateyamaria sp. TaxID=455651 RepID=UPI0026161BD5|nr:efflux RND transporter periplasmic adaptor subunit [uncultured Tateyamaria sp.]